MDQSLLAIANRSQIVRFAESYCALVMLIILVHVRLYEVSYILKNKNIWTNQERYLVHLRQSMPEYAFLREALSLYIRPSVELGRNGIGLRH